MEVMDQLRAVGAKVPHASEERLEEVRRQLVEAGARSHLSERRRRLPQRALAAVAAVALVGGGSVAVWAIAFRTSNPVTNTTIECGPDTYINAEGASPVLDCYDALSAQGGNVPPLLGWITPGGMVAVLAKGDAPPRGSTPLPSSFQVSAGVRYATDALNDTVGPLQLGCLSASSATAYAAGQLAIAGLVEWRVDVGTPSGPTESASCTAYVGVIDAQAQEVVLQPGPGSLPQDNDNPEVRLDDLLHGQLVAGSGAHCLDIAAAERLASSDAARVGIPSDEMLISDAGAIGATARACATPFVEPAGDVDVVLWMAPRAS